MGRIVSLFAVALCLSCFVCFQEPSAKLPPAKTPFRVVGSSRRRALEGPRDAGVTFSNDDGPRLTHEYERDRVGGSQQQQDEQASPSVSHHDDASQSRTSDAAAVINPPSPSSTAVLPATPAPSSPLHSPDSRGVGVVTPSCSPSRASPAPTSAPVADPVASASDGAVLRIGQRDWRVSRRYHASSSSSSSSSDGSAAAAAGSNWPWKSDADAPPAALVPALLLRARGSKPGDRSWDPPIPQPLLQGEEVDAALARLHATQPALMAQYAYQNETGSALQPAYAADVKNGPTHRGARLLSNPAVSMYHSLQPLPNQSSPYEQRWPVTLPALEPAACENARGYPDLIGFAGEVCMRPDNRKRFRPHWLDQAPMGAKHPLDVRLPPWHRPAAVLAVTNALVLNFAHDYEAFFVSAGGAVISGEAIQAPARPDAPIIRLETAATIGFSRYLALPGHFPNENLPRLLYLDAVVPKHVPLIYPTPVPGIPRSYPSIANWLPILREMGAFAGRRFVFGGTHNHAYDVRRLYMFAHLTSAGREGDDDTASAAEDPSPYASYAPQNLLAARIRAWAGRVLGRTDITATTDTQQQQQPSDVTAAVTAADFHPLPPSRIVVLRRTGNREVVNSQQVIDAIAARWPHVPLDSFEPAVTPGYDLRTSLLAIANATLVIAPHGAGNNNILALSPGAAFLEFGPAPEDRSSKFQPGFNNFCRVIGLRYYWLHAKPASRDDVERFATPSPSPGTGSADGNGKPANTGGAKYVVDVSEVLQLVTSALEGEAAATAQSHEAAIRESATHDVRGAEDVTTAAAGTSSQQDKRRTMRTTAPDATIE